MPLTLCSNSEAFTSIIYNIGTICRRKGHLVNRTYAVMFNSNQVGLMRDEQLSDACVAAGTSPPVTFLDNFLISKNVRTVLSANRKFLVPDVVFLGKISYLTTSEFF